MAGKGPPPKPPGVGTGRKKSSAATMTGLPAKSPKLPRRSPTWRKATRTWWAEVWSSPMASNYLDADVPALVRIAEMIDRLDRLGPDETALAVKLTAEIRVAQSAFGLTPGDRLRLHWTIRPPAEPEPKPKKKKRPDPRENLGKD